MIIEQSQTRTHKVQNETLNGINVLAFLTAADGSAISPTTMGGNYFDPAMVNVTVQLKRNLQTIDIFNNNLAVLAAYNTILKGGALWRKGITSVAAGAPNQKSTRMAFLYFGGHINVSGTDELLITVTVNKNTFGTGINASQSHLQVEVNQSIGVEVGIPRFHSYAIQQHQSEDNVNIGDNCLRLAMLSFEEDKSKTIFNSASLSSDRLDWTKNEDELILSHFDNFTYNASEKYLDGLADVESPMFFPHTRLIHDKDEIDRAKLKFTMVPQNIEASKNFICYTTYITSQEILQKALIMKQKHNQKDSDKVPVSLTN